MRNKPITRTKPKSIAKFFYRRFSKGVKKHFRNWHANMSWAAKWAEYRDASNWHKKHHGKVKPPQKPPGSYDRAVAAVKKHRKLYSWNQKGVNRFWNPKH